MAVKWIEQTGKGLLGFWEITEQVDQLLHALQPIGDEAESYASLKIERRQKEWLAARLLLRSMTNQAEKIGYDPTGKPHLTNSNWNISLSHSSGCVVILLHPEAHPGIDIELITRDVTIPAKKFLSPKEMNDCKVDGVLSNKDVMLRWCSKEAIFKMVPYSNVDFAEQIACQALPLTTQEGQLKASYLAPGKNLEIILDFRMIGNMLMVWGWFFPDKTNSL